MRSLFALGFLGFLIFVVSCGSTPTPPADVINMGSGGRSLGQGGMSVVTGGKAGTGSGGAGTTCTAAQLLCSQPIPGSTVMKMTCVHAFRFFATRSISKPSMPGI